jgi:hypothetical protein
MDADTLQLAPEQVLAPVAEEAVEPLISPRTLTALRRRFPRGSGLFLLAGSGELFFDPGRGMALFLLTCLDPAAARNVPRLSRADLAPEQPLQRIGGLR